MQGGSFYALDVQKDSTLKVQSAVRKVMKGFHSLPCAWGRAQQHVKER